MNVIITEYLAIDLDSETWLCRRCDGVLGSARRPYKEFTRVYNRDPREIHRPLLDPERYEYTFAPDPRVCALLEFYCPSCGVLMEAEYTVPGLAPLLDLEIDVDRLKEQWRDRPQLSDTHGGAVAPLAK